LPRLLDLGAGKCIPCKMMAPILDELKGTVRGRVRGRVYRRVGEAGRS
jgi:thioredoxin 1